MDSSEPDDYVATFYIGQHEKQRSRPVTDDVVRRAHGCNVGVAIEIRSSMGRLSICAV